VQTSNFLIFFGYLLFKNKNAARQKMKSVLAAYEEDRAAMI